MLRRLTHAARTKLWIALIMVISFPFLLCVAPLLWGWSSYVVLTGSMEDRVPSGSVVVTRPARMEDL
ncbi:MAG: hypothetical protein K0Q73_7310 [Paenibacillus sp.]|jgi:hypothetical protein|nr:hypothetical protein [Paenibacillus sp.]